MLVALAVLLAVALVLQYRSRSRAARDHPVVQQGVLVLPPHLAESLRMPPSLVRPSGKASTDTQPASAPFGPPSPPQ
jgi:hypothetical protein